MEPLKSSRLTLDPLQVSDADSIALYAGSGPQELEAAKITLGRWLETVRRLGPRSGGGWTLNIPNGASLIGVCYYGGVGNASNETALSYWIDARARAKGYGAEAVARIVRYLFEEVAFSNLIADVEMSNVASRKLLLKIGFLPLTRHETPGVAVGNGRAAQRLVLTSEAWRAKALRPDDGR